jgi:sugar O-acyltransferase (sialic acid O-acetyltransferase NeuD family)
MKPLVLFGTGDIARLAHYYFTRDTGRTVVAFTVDAAFCTTPEYLGLPLVPFEEVAGRFPPATHDMFVALSYRDMNHLRAAKYAAAKEQGYTLATYLSSRCTWLADTPPGDNCFILEDNTVQPFVTIGNDVTLWSGNHIGHDSTVEDHTFISSHVVVSGHCRIGPYCFLGVNSTLRNGITIAAETLVGAGAILMKDTADRDVYVPERTPKYAKTSDKVRL